MLMLSQNIVRDHLTYERASQLIRQGFANLAGSRLESPARHVFKAQGSAPALGFMPAVSDKHLSAKIAAVQYTNPESQLDSHQGAVLLFSRTTGMLQAVIDASELTAIRTVAVSHLAMTYYLKDALKQRMKLAVVGSGVQAFHHIKMASSCFGIKEFVVVSRSPARVQELRDATAAFDVSIEYRPYDAALRDCGIIVTATHGDAVILTRHQVDATCLILAIGACQPKAQELASDILEVSHFVIDHPESLQGCGEGLSRLDSHSENPATAFNPDCFLKTSGRINIFKAVGLGFEDLVCATYLYELLVDSCDTPRIADFGGRRGY